MTLLVGTRDGLYRLDDEQPVKLIDGRARVTRTTSLGAVAVAGQSVYTARTDWEAIFEAPRRLTAIGEWGDRVLVGTRGPPTVFHTADGETWQQFDVPERPPTQRHLVDQGTVVTGEQGPPVKHISGVPEMSQQILVGLEGDTLLVSYDGGETWRSRDRGLGADLHTIHPCAQHTWLAATGNGLYRTRNGGRTWVRLDTSQTYQQYTYFHGITEVEGTVVAAGGAHMPGSWTGEGGAEGIILRQSDGVFKHESYPGAPSEYPMLLTAVNETLHCGTVAQDLDQSGSTPGRVLEYIDGRWRQRARVPAGVTSLAAAN